MYVVCFIFSCFLFFDSHFFVVLSVTTTALLVELLHPSHGLEQDLVDGQREEVVGFTAAAVSFVFVRISFFKKKMTKQTNKQKKISSLIGWLRIVI